MDLVAASPVPIALSIDDLAYERRVEQGTLGELVADRRCPRCAGPLELTNRRRRRGRVRLVEGRCVASDFVALLAKCRCGHMPRVLPASLMAGKVYTVEAQEAACREYHEGRAGLRVAVRRLGCDAPHFTTLHGWLGGVGGFALGLETPADSCPASVLLEETKRRHLPDLRERWEASVDIAPWKFRSEARRELLAAGVRLFGIATAAVATMALTTTAALSEWTRFALTWRSVTAITWSSRRRGTAIQPAAVGIGVGFEQLEPDKPETPPCRAPSRSPPSASR